MRLLIGFTKGYQSRLIINFRDFWINSVEWENLCLYMLKSDYSSFLDFKPFAMSIIQFYIKFNHMYFREFKFVVYVEL